MVRNRPLHAQFGWNRGVARSATQFVRIKLGKLTASPDWKPGLARSEELQKILAFTNGVAAAIAHFVAFEVGNFIQPSSRLGFVTTGWMRSVIAVLRMEAVIDMAVEALRAMKPWACADENPAGKPLGTIIAIGCAIVGCDVIVAVRTFGGDSDVDGYLSLRFRSGYSKAECDDSS